MQGAQVSSAPIETSDFMALLSNPAAFKAELDSYSKARDDAQRAIADLSAKQSKMDAALADISKREAALKVSQEQLLADQAAVTERNSQLTDLASALTSRKLSLDEREQEIAKQQQQIAASNQAAAAFLADAKRKSDEAAKALVAVQKKHAIIKAAVAQLGD